MVVRLLVASCVVVVVDVEADCVVVVVDVDADCVVNIVEVDADWVETVVDVASNVDVARKFSIFQECLSRFSN